jgi:adenosyl cobinamide kinase/adenosyl cobinamide phosphate guanylyltransferase
VIFEKTKILKDFAKLNKLVYGFPKSGKTTFAAAQYDKEGKEPLFIATEEGHHALEVYAVRVTSWDGFKKLITVLKTNVDEIRATHSCLIVDLVSDLDMWCSEYVAKKNSVQHLADLSFGKGFALHKQEFQSAIRELLEILPVTFIAHSQEKDLQWNNETIKVQAPSLTKGCLEFINGKVDCIMWVLPANTKRAMPEITMKNTTMSIAGSRYRQLARSFTLDPNDPSKTFGEIQKVFANEKDAVIEEKEQVKKTVSSSTDSAQVSAN